MKLYDGREKFYQYDTNQKLICEDCAVGEEIHFSNSAHSDAAICLTYDLDGAVVVNVPNLYLLSAVDLNVYSMRTEDDGRCTISRHVFGVVPRKKPSDYVYEETEVKSYAELDRRIKKLEENDGAGIDLTGAAVGQVAQIAEVDKNGAPTKWHPADLPAVSAMTGATADADGVSGVVPAPAAGDEGKFLRGDGTWGNIDIPEGGIDQDELQSAVNDALEQAKAGLLVFEDSYVDNTANWLTNGYTKVSQTATSGHPPQCTGSDKWGVLFFIAENAENGTGTQMYFPIDGTYKGRIFTRSITKRTPGTWYLLPTMNDIPTGGGGGGTTDHTLGISGASVGQIARITAVDGDGVPTAWASVDLPAGGSGGGWNFINTVELTEQVAKISIDKDSEGNRFAYNEIAILAKTLGTGDSSCVIGVKACYVEGYQEHEHDFGWSVSTISNAGREWTAKIVRYGDFRFNLFISDGNTASSSGEIKVYSDIAKRKYSNWTVIPAGKIKGVYLKPYNGGVEFTAGTAITIFGR